MQVDIIAFDEPIVKANMDVIPHKGNTSIFYNGCRYGIKHISWVIENNKQTHVEIEVERKSTQAKTPKELMQVLKDITDGLH